MNNGDSEEAASSISALDVVADLAGTAITGIPAPVRRGLGKAIERLCVAAVELPVAYLESFAATKRAEVAAQGLIASRVAEKLAAGVQVPDGASKMAGDVWINKIIGRQRNVDAVAVYAIQHASSEAGKSQDTTTTEGEISDDWLNAFEREAENASSEDMRFAFGRILAGEAKRPGTFSTRTVRLLAQLPTDVAQTFQRMCGMVTAVRNASGEYIDARVWSLGEHVGMNGLSKFGLSFTTCMELVDAGLVASELDSQLNYSHTLLVPEGQFGQVLLYRGTEHGLIWKNVDQLPERSDIGGLALTRAGRELMQVVDGPEDASYTAERLAHLHQLGFDVGLIAWVEVGKRFRYTRQVCAPKESVS